MPARSSTPVPARDLLRRDLLRRVRALTIVVLSFAGGLLMLAGCGGGDPGSPLDPGDGQGPGTGGSGGGGGGGGMRATIQGLPWQSGAGGLTSPAQTIGPGGYSMTGTSQQGSSLRSLTLSLMNIPGPGTYPLGTGGNVSGGTAIVADGSGAWLTPLSGAAGTISITTLTDSRFVATFSFTADPASGTATGNRTVTAGSVDLPISVVVPPGPVPERSRNRVQATFNGVAWNAATVATTGATSFLVLAASNTQHMLTLSLADFAGPGTYPLGGSGPRVQSITVRSPDGAVTSQPTCCWTSLAPGATGSVVILPSGPGRVTGTFTFTLPPQAGTGATAPLVLANGTFDLGVDG